MAAVSDDISDGDLRAKLKENGISAGPITPTTRDLYIRKLNKKLSGVIVRPTSSGERSPKKALSPRKSPSRSPARRSTGATPPRVPQRKLVGLSSDEEDTPRETTVRNSRRLSARFSPKLNNSPAATYSPARLHDEQSSGLLRFRKPVETPCSSSTSTLPQDDEKTESDGQVAIPRDYNTFKHSAGAKVSPYSGLRQLFLKKSIEEGRKNREESHKTPQKTSYDDVEMEEETKRSYLWGLLFVCALVLIVLINSQHIFAFIWNGNSSKLKICGPDSGNTELGTCLKKEDFVESLLEQLQLELGTKNGLVECNYLPKDSLNMTKTQLGDWISDHIKDNNFSQQELLEDIFKLSQNASNYDLRFLNNDEAPATSPNDIASVTTFIVLKPLSCRIKEALSKVVWQLVTLFAVVLLMIAIYFYVKYRWMIRERKTRQMFELVDQILDVLKNHDQECRHNKALSPYLAIPHVRDMLIKPSEREAMKEVWELAVKFLSAKDSRVRVESQRIAGEDFEVWRLLHHGSSSSPQSVLSPNSKEEKIWQGQAFEDFQSAVNPPLISPTPCLKIRNMFEPVMEIREQWHVFIQDAILEKCTEKGAAIVHIAVDQSSNEGCVYVKCANHRSSGAAFRAIHGCWFDGRLVTVKFLTLKRYHQRFPDAMNAKVPIKPSGTSNSTIPKLKSAPVNESDTDSESDEHVAT